MNSPTEGNPLIFITASAALADTATLDEDDSPPSWVIDELAIAVSRAALARGAHIAVPSDDAFAPLLAQVALQYLVPRFAEDDRPTRRDKEFQRFEPPITFVGNDFVAESRDAPNAPEWMRLFSQISGFPAATMPLDNLLDVRRPLAAVAIGGNEATNQLLIQVRSVGIPIWRLQETQFNSMEKSDQNDIRGFEQQIAEQLEMQRSQLRFFRPASEEIDGRESRPPPAPVNFNRYPPYMLYGQMLIDKILHRRDDHTEDTD